MTLPDDLARIEKTLTPEVRLLVSFMRQQYEEQRRQAEEQRQQAEEQRQQNQKLMATIDQLNAQLAELRGMLFGRKSEKLPPIQSEVRRAVQAEELFGRDESTPGASDLSEEEKATLRRKQARKKSEPARKKARKLRQNLPVVREPVAD